MLIGMPSTIDREIGAVVEVEAAEKVLVGLALAAVLGDDQPRYGLEDLTGAVHRAASMRSGETWPSLAVSAVPIPPLGGAATTSTGGKTICAQAAPSPIRHAAAVAASGPSLRALIAIVGSGVQMLVRAAALAMMVAVGRDRDGNKVQLGVAGRRAVSPARRQGR